MAHLNLARERRRGKQGRSADPSIQPFKHIVSYSQLLSSPVPGVAKKWGHEILRLKSVD